VGDYLLNLSSTCAAPGNPAATFTPSMPRRAPRPARPPAWTTSSGWWTARWWIPRPAWSMLSRGGRPHRSRLSLRPQSPMQRRISVPHQLHERQRHGDHTGRGYEFLLAGDFDNAYYTSTPSSPSGHLYVVGNTGAGNNTLYQVSVSSNAMNTTASAGPALSNNYTKGIYAAGLEVAEFYNGSKDYVFVSVLSYGLPTSCNNGLANGCVMASMSPAAPERQRYAHCGDGGGRRNQWDRHRQCGHHSLGRLEHLLHDARDQTCTTSAGLGVAPFRPRRPRPEVGIRRRLSTRFARARTGRRARSRQAVPRGSRIRRCARRRGRG